jgi:GT2 family glycosyltransferase
MTKTSIIIPSYVIDNHVHDCLQKCFKNLFEYTDHDSFELIIVDNGSIFGSGLMKEKSDIYVHTKKPLGYAKAANMGIKLANYENLVILNNDIFVIYNGWLPDLIEEYEKTKGGIMSPMEYDRGDKEIHYDEHWYSLFFTKKNVIEKVGLFDESLPFRFHDQDYSIRVKLAGFEVMRTGRVLVTGLNSATYSKIDKNTTKEDNERSEMIKRYGAAHFQEWIQMKSKK